MAINTDQVSETLTPSTGTLNVGGAIAPTTALGVAYGGTGQTTASAGFNALSPVTTTGDLIIGNGTNSSTRLAIGANTYVLTSNGTTATWSAAAGGGGSFATTVLNDISNYFDNVTSVFPLTLEQSNITSSNFTDSKDLEVIINGFKLSPHVTQITYPWLNTYDYSNRGFRAVATSTGANVIIYNAPAIGDSAFVTIINNSSSLQTRKYPYSATTIALGD